MNKEELTLKQKIAQMFITGFSGDNYKSNKYFMNLLENGLGGVIFFTQNIKSEIQIKRVIENLNKEASVPLFLSIDQEGGRVERTEKIHGGKKYLSAKNAYEMGISFLQNQTKEIALELKQYGFNMNFAPVLDVNTNEKNPIIGERAFSSETQEVITASKVVLKEYEKYGVITVGKHFPGHGDASMDSHKTLPTINLGLEELTQIHIKPFEEAIKNNMPAIMVAHVLYPALEEEQTPASLSKKIVTDLLQKQLNFDGVIISDDMEMNAVKGLSRLEACIKGINAGITMFIFRDTNKDIFELINNLEKAVLDGLIDEKLIDSAIEKIFKLKYQYGIIR